MSVKLSKKEIIKAVEKLPEDDLAIEDVVERLILLQKIQTGLEEKGKGIPQEKVREEFEKLKAQRSWR